MRGDGGRVGADRVPIVLEVRAVGGPDLHELGAALGHDVGHSKAAPDLHQFPARDDGRSAVRQRVERQHEGRGPVVDDESVFCPGELAEERRAVHVPRAAFPGADVVFEGRVA